MKALLTPDSDLLTILGHFGFATFARGGIGGVERQEFFSAARPLYNGPGIPGRIFEAQCLSVTEFPDLP